MFETLQPAQPEPTKDWENWVPIAFYWFWCPVGIFGLLISLWKHGTARPLGLICYGAVLILALYFLVVARTRRSTMSGVTIANIIFVGLVNLPTFVHLWSM